MIYQLECVAQAFYDTVHEGRQWDDELEIIKEEFRLFARDAIALLHQHQERSLAEAFYWLVTLKDQDDLSSAA